MTGSTSKVLSSRIAMVAAVPGPGRTPTSRPTTTPPLLSTGAAQLPHQVTWQGAPQELLPEEPTDDSAAIPRRTDGVLVLPQAVSG